MNYLFVALGFLAGLLAAGWISIPLARRWKEREDLQAKKLFLQQREYLEAKFFDMARSLGKPRGLRWVDCKWLDGVSFGRDRQTNLMTAFAGINIQFEAIEGGDMEDVAAVSTIRDAVAVFHYQNGSWGTGGKALFNMNANDVLERLVAQYSPVT